MKKFISLILVAVCILSIGVFSFADDKGYKVTIDYPPKETKENQTTVKGNTTILEKHPTVLWYTDSKGNKYYEGDKVDKDLDLTAVYAQIMFRPWVKGSDEGIYFAITPSDDLVVKVDKVETDKYTYSYGKLVLDPEFLETLEPGYRVLEVYSTAGNFWDCFEVVE